MVKAIFYLLTVVLTIFTVYKFIDSVELVICRVRRKIPLVPSTRGLRRAVVREIRDNFPDARTAVDIGSGYGGLARLIARRCRIDTVGLENMPFAAAVSKITDRITFSRNRTVWCDAFEYLGRHNKFDIAVAYMGPGFNEDLGKYTDKFDVLITLVMPATGLTPTRIVTLPHGYTRYGGKKYPHKLYVYDLRKE